MSQATCAWQFRHPQCPRDRCSLPATSDGLCVFHSQQATPNFAEKLVREVSNPRHWLEGIVIKEDLNGVRLSGARMPGASFEGLKLVNVVLNDALLEGANFRSAILEGVLLYRSNLRGAAFDQATLQKAGNTPVDLRDADLGGASFIGAKLAYPKLLGSRFSNCTMIARLLDTPCFEMATAAWDDAATVYAIVGKYAADLWDFSSADFCSYRSMTCMHRKVLRTGPLNTESLRNYWQNWVAPTLRPRVAGWLWIVHREVWGYGLRPLRALATMFAVIIAFGLLVFPIIGTLQHLSTGLVDALRLNFASSRLLDAILLSFSSFVTLNYGDITFFGKPAEFAAVVEALLGAVLVSMFVVALAGKYVRRL